MDDIGAGGGGVASDSGSWPAAIPDGLCSGTSGSSASSSSSGMRSGNAGGEDAFLLQQRQSALASATLEEYHRGAASVTSSSSSCSSNSGGARAGVNAGVVNLVCVNVRGLMSKIDEVVIANNRDQRGEFSADVLGIVETWLKPQEPAPTMTDFLFDDVRSPISDPDAGHHGRGFGGVGVFTRAVGYPTGFGVVEKSKNARILWVCIAGSTPTYAAFVYGPQENAAVSEKDAFWKELEESTRLHGLRGDTVLLGDFNARVGDLVGDSKVTNNGKRLLDFVAARDLIILNSDADFAFGRSTCESDARSTIDYVLVPRPSRHRVVNMSIVEHTLHTDHLGVRLLWRADMRHTPKPKLQKRMRFKLPKDGDYTRYRTALAESLRVWRERELPLWLSVKDSSSSTARQNGIEKLWRRWRSAVVDAAKSGLAIAPPPRRLLVRGWDDELAAMMKEKRSLDKAWKLLRQNAAAAASAAADGSRTLPGYAHAQAHARANAAVDVARALFVAHRRATQQMVKRKKREADDAMFGNMASLHAGATESKQEFYRMLKQLRGSRKHAELPSRMMDPATGMMTDSDSSTRAAWRDYFIKASNTAPAQAQARARAPPSGNSSSASASASELFDQYFYSRVTRRIHRYRIRATRDRSGGPERDEHISSTSSCSSDRRGDQRGPKARVAGSAALDEALTLSEVQDAVKQLRSRKAVDHVQMVNELMIHGGDAMLSSLHELLSAIWSAEYIPLDWCAALIVPIYKNSGDRSSFSNYRPIALTSVVFKLYETILQRRISNRVEKDGRIGEEQGGFRPGRSTIDHVFVLSELIASRREQKLDTYLCFLDLSKAYDMTWRDGIWDRLLSCGLHGKIWRVLVDMYRLVSNRVMVNGVPTESFESNIGVRQGSVLSPVLFSLFLSGVIEEWNARGLGVSIASANSSSPHCGAKDARKVAGLLFADDIVLVAGSVNALRAALAVMDQHAARWRYRFNHSKCAVMAICKQEPRSAAGAAAAAAARESWMLQGKPISESSSYKYLGVWFDANAGWQTWSENALARGRSGLGILWYCGARARALPFATAANMVEVYLWPSMLYGAEAVSPTATVENQQLGVIVNGVNRQLLGSNDRRTSGNLMQREVGFGAKSGTGAAAAASGLSIAARIHRVKLAYLYKLQSMPATRLTRQVFVMRLDDTAARRAARAQPADGAVSSAQHGINDTVRASSSRALTKPIYGWVERCSRSHSDTASATASQ